MTDKYKQYEADLLPELPVRSTVQVLNLTDRLKVQAKPRKPQFPTFVEYSLDQMKMVQDKVNEARTDKSFNRKRRRMLRKLLSQNSAAWRGLKQAMDAKLVLVGDVFLPIRSDAERVLEILFNGGLGFLKGRPDRVWRAGEDRLLRAEEALMEVLEDLGAIPNLRAVKVAHAALGDELALLGDADPVDAPSVPMSKMVTKLRYRMRVYVMSVYLWADMSPERDALIRELLAPLFEAKQAMMKERAEKEKAAAEKAKKAKEKALEGKAKKM